MAKKGKGGMMKMPAGKGNKTYAPKIDVMSKFSKGAKGGLKKMGKKR